MAPSPQSSLVAILVDCAKSFFNLLLLYQNVLLLFLLSLALLCPPNTSGLNASLVELTDFICAAQISKVEDAHLPVEEKVINLTILSGYKFNHQKNKLNLKLCNYFYMFNLFSCINGVLNHSFIYWFYLYHVEYHVSKVIFFFIYFHSRGLSFHA